MKISEKELREIIRERIVVKEKKNLVNESILGIIGGWIAARAGGGIVKAIGKGLLALGRLALTPAGIGAMIVAGAGYVIYDVLSAAAAGPASEALLGVGENNQDNIYARLTKSIDKLSKELKLASQEYREENPVASEAFSDASKNIKNYIVVINDDKASALAKKLYTATKGGVTMGMGTTVGHIKDVFIDDNKGLTGLDYSKIALEFEKIYSGALAGYFKDFKSSLLSALSTDLGQEQFDEIVEDHLKNVRSERFVNFKNEVMSLSELEDKIKELESAYGEVYDPAVGFDEEKFRGTFGGFVQDGPDDMFDNFGDERGVDDEDTDTQGSAKRGEREGDSRRGGSGSSDYSRDFSGVRSSDEVEQYKSRFRTIRGGLLSYENIKIKVYRPDIAGPTSLEKLVGESELSGMASEELAYSIIDRLRTQGSISSDGLVDFRTLKAFNFKVEVGSDRKAVKNKKLLKNGIRKKYKIDLVRREGPFATAGFQKLGEKIGDFFEIKPARDLPKNQNSFELAILVPSGIYDLSVPFKK